VEAAEGEEAAEEAAAAKKEARARGKAKAEVQPASTDDNEYTKDYPSEGDTSSSDASNSTTSSEEVKISKRRREDDEAGPSTKELLIVKNDFEHIFFSQFLCFIYFNMLHHFENSILPTNSFSLLK
jgi:hypothetical protein